MAVLRRTMDRLAAALPVLLLALGAWMGGGCGGAEKGAAGVMDARSRDLLMAGQEALQSNDFEGALAYVDSVDRHRPDLAGASFLRARILSEMLRFDEAEAAYRRVLVLDASYPGVWNNLGNNAFRQRAYSKAIDHYRAELAGRPAAIPWHGIGKAYAELGKVDSARAALDRALALDSTYAPAYVSYALLLQDEGALPAALRYAARAHAVRPDDLEARYLVGALLVAAGESEAALPHLRRVAEAWPWHHAATYNLGQALVRLGRDEEAQPYLKRAEGLRELQAKIENMEMLVRARPDDPDAHAALASTLRRAGRNNDALHAYNVALHLDPTNLEVQNNLANLYLIQGDTAATLRTYHHILEQDPALVDVWLNLGVVYAISGRTDAARQAWERALQLQPGHPAARAYLARLGS